MSKKYLDLDGLKEYHKGVNNALKDKADYIYIDNTANAHINTLKKQFAVGYSANNISAVANTAWRRQTSPIANRSRASTYGNGYYVIVGTSGDVAYSTDAVVWTKLTAFTTAVLTGVAYGNGKFIAVDSDGKIWSVDLVPNGTWQHIHSASSGIIIEGIRFINDRFFAVGDNGYLSYSLDGITWYDVISNTTQHIIDITYGNGKYVACCYGGVIVYSTNGRDWFNASDESFITNYRHIAYGKEMFVAGGQKGSFRYSYDGVTWHSGSHTSTATISWIRGFTYAYGRFFAVVYGSNPSGQILVSENGINWTPVYNASVMLWTINEYNGIFVTSGNSGHIYTLDLGIEWTDEEPDADHVYYRFLLNKNNGNNVVSESYYDRDISPKITQSIDENTDKNSVPTAGATEQTYVRKDSAIDEVELLALLD